MLHGLLRWFFTLAGAAIGSHGGRIAAAALRGEETQPLLMLDRAALLRPDLVPGFLAVEIVGKLLKLGPWSSALVAAAGAAAGALAEGPLVSRPSGPKASAGYSLVREVPAS